MVDGKKVVSVLNIRLDKQSSCGALSCERPASCYAKSTLLQWNTDQRIRRAFPGWGNRGSAAEQGWGAWDGGRRDAQPAPGQRWGASGWERRNTEPYAEQRWSTWDWGPSRRPTPQSQQSLQPAPPHSRDRGSSAPNRANTDDRRNRARQTPDRLQNGPLDLTRASKQTHVRSTP
jgi:hypothetical protein